MSLFFYTCYLFRLSNVPDLAYASLFLSLLMRHMNSIYFPVFLSFSLSSQVFELMYSIFWLHISSCMMKHLPAMLKLLAVPVFAPEHITDGSAIADNDSLIHSGQQQGTDAAFVQVSVADPPCRPWWRGKTPPKHKQSWQFR